MPINQSPLLTAHLEKILQLEKELMTQEGFTSDMIPDSHVQLLVLAIVAAAEYNKDKAFEIYSACCQYIASIVQEELENAPVIIKQVEEIKEKQKEFQSVLVFPKSKYKVN